jgi:hypothetical protein
VGDPEAKRVQVVPRAVDLDQLRVQLALQPQPRRQQLSQAVAEAAPKSSKIVQVALSKNMITIEFPQHRK